MRYNAIRYVTSATVKLDPKFREPQSPSQRSLDDYIIQRELKAARARSDDSERPAVDDSEVPEKAPKKPTKGPTSTDAASGRQQSADRGHWVKGEYMLLGKAYSKESADKWHVDAGIDPKTKCLPYLFGVGSCTTESCLCQCRSEAPEHADATSAAHVPEPRWRASSHRVDSRARKRDKTVNFHKDAVADASGGKKRK